MNKILRNMLWLINTFQITVRRTHFNYDGLDTMHSEENETKVYIYTLTVIVIDFPHSSDGRESIYNTRHPGLIPGLGRSLGEGNGNPLQYFAWRTPRLRGAWRAAVYGVAKSRTRLNG